METNWARKMKLKLISTWLVSVAEFLFNDEWRISVPGRSTALIIKCFSLASLRAVFKFPEESSWCYRLWRFYVCNLHPVASSSLDPSFCYFRSKTEQICVIFGSFAFIAHSRDRLNPLTFIRFYPNISYRMYSSQRMDGRIKGPRCYSPLP